MWVFAGRSAGTSVARLAEIRPDFECAGEHIPASPVARVERELADVAGDVYHHPAPQAAAGRRVGIDAGPLRVAGASVAA